MSGIRDRAVGTVRLNIEGAKELPPEHEMSGWLRRELARLDYKIVTGRIPFCGHRSLDLMGGLLELWAPVRVYCAACFTPALEPGSEDDGRCDRCGVVSPGGVHRGAFVGGSDGLPITILYGLCGDCHDKEVGADA